MSNTVKAASCQRSFSNNKITLKPWFTAGMSKQVIKEPFNIELIYHIKTY